MNIENSEHTVLLSLQNDLKFIGTMMQDFARQVIQQEISRYPVYIAFQAGDSKLGRPFLRKDRQGLNWNYNASILEELVKAGVVLPEKIDDFRMAYGDPEERACIFVALAGESGLIFVPYEIEEEEQDTTLK